MAAKNDVHKLEGENFQRKISPGLHPPVDETPLAIEFLIEREKQLTIAQTRK